MSRSILRAPLLGRLFLLVIISALSGCSKELQKKSLAVKNDTCLLFFESKEAKKKRSCSAFIVSKNLLASAAHCAEDFQDSSYQLSAKNSVYGVCPTAKGDIKLKGLKIAYHPEYAFKKTAKKHRDAAIIAVSAEANLEPSISLATGSERLKDLILKGECASAGYKETSDPAERQRLYLAPTRPVFLQAISHQGIMFQREYEKSLSALFYGGIALSHLGPKARLAEASYPGPGYSGAPLICSLDGKKHKVGMYAGGFEDSQTWAVLYFVETLGEWMQKQAPSI